MTKRILMVCLGNICRSPLAHGIMAEISPNFFVDSAGTGSYHIGSPPDQRSVRVAQDNGIDISRQSARQFQSIEYNKFEHIFVICLLYTSPSPRDMRRARMPSSA